MTEIYGTQHISVIARLHSSRSNLSLKNFTFIYNSQIQLAITLCNMDIKQPAIYILTNKPNGTLYIGVTSNLIKRVYEHKQGAVPGFTKKYFCKQLVYFEQFDNMLDAIEREKQLKGGSRAKKIALISRNNPSWVDLYWEIV